MKTKLILSSLALAAAVSVNAQPWLLNGNAGTNPSNYVGTTDNNSLRFGVNSVFSGIMDPQNFPGNVTFGYNVGNNTGYQNALVGYQMANNLTTGNALSGVGFWALFSNKDGYCNSAVGNRAMYNNTSGFYNTASGYVSMQANTSGYYNSAYGVSSLYNNNGNFNSAVGVSALGGNTSGSYNSALGYAAGTSLGTENNATALGAGAVSNNSNRVWVGGNNDDVWCALGVWSGSDQRFKTSVKEEVKGLDFIKLLRPVMYNFDTKKLTEHVTSSMPDSVRKHYLSQDFSRTTNVRQSGFIAQEVLEAAKTSGYNFSGVHSPETDHDIYGLSYAQFVVPLVKAVQEQQAMIEQQKADMASLVKQLDAQKQELTNLKTGTATGLNSIDQQGANGFDLGQNVPNPFTNETVVKYTLPQSVSSAYMAVYDLSGKQVKTFPITEKGSSSITITSEKLEAGIYIYSVVADGKVIDSKRMIVASK